MEVNVNGEYIELGNSLPAITKKSIDINNPASRFLEFTNKFDIPFTKENARKLESPHAVGSNNRAFDKAYNVNIEDVFKIFSGKGFLESSNFEKFSLQVVESCVDLFKALEVRLNQISWDDKDIELTTTSIDANDSIDYDSPWIWGKCCLHETALKENTDLTTGDARCKYSRPSFHVQGLLKRAIVQNDYTYSESTINLALSAAHEKFYFTSYQKTISTTYNPAGTVAISGLNTNDFAHSDITVTSTSIDVAAVKTIFRLRGTIVSNANVTLVIRATDNVDGTKVTESKLNIAIGTQEVDFNSAEFKSDNGMTVDLRIDGTGAVTVNALLYTIISDKDVDLSGNPFLGYKIKVYDNLPELTYLDMYRTICVTGNQFHVVDNFSKTFEFDTFANINKLNTVDWSDKFIINSESITSSYPGLFQRNMLKYSNDKTVAPQLGWSSFDTYNESFEKEGDYIVLKFGASNDVTIDSNEIAQVNVYSDTFRLTVNVPTMRLFSIQGSRLVFAPISWDTIKQDYYENYFNSLYRIRAIEAELNLSKFDVLNWNVKQLVYIDYFKTTFFVLEISNFIPGRKTKVKLLGYGR